MVQIESISEKGYKTKQSKRYINQNGEWKNRIFKRTD